MKESSLSYLPEGTYVEFKYGIIEGAGWIRGIVCAALGVDLVDDMYIIQLKDINLRSSFFYPYSSTCIFKNTVTKSILPSEEDELLTRRLEHGIIS